MLNACQASRKGILRPAVTVSLSEDDQRIRISVSDTGNGVPPAILETLFQPFVSFGKVNGTGLGLTVAQHIAQEHGGEVKLEETSAEGTTFSILLYKCALLPAEPALASPMDAASSPLELPVPNWNSEATQENL
jgi:signal transduction histidine kinase